MGTSSSSSGPGAGVSFDPPWLDIIASDFLSPQQSIAGEDNGEPIDADTDKTEPFDLAPPRRFGTARRYLGEYVADGNKDSLRKALGSYSRKGMGGATNVARRMRASTAAGVRLFNLLQGIRESSDEKIQDWVRQLSAKNLSFQELADEIIDQIISTGGSLEEESCKNSMAQAMSDFLTDYPDVDLMNMDDDNIWTVIERFISNEAFNRLTLDIGQPFESAKYSPKEVVSRLKEMNDYLRAEISAQIQELRDSNQNPSTKELDNLLQSAIKITYEIFEEAI